MNFGWPFPCVGSSEDLRCRTLVSSLLAALWGRFPGAEIFLGSPAPQELFRFTSLIEIGLTEHVCTLWWPGDIGDLRRKAKGPDGRENSLEQWGLGSRFGKAGVFSLWHRQMQSAGRPPRCALGK